MIGPKMLLKKYICLLFVIIPLQILFGQEVSNSIPKNIILERNDTLQIQSHLQKGLEFYYKKSDTSYYYFNKALQLSRLSKNVKYQAITSMYIADLHEENEKYKESLELYLHSIDLYKSINDECGIAKAYTKIGDSFGYLNSLDKTIEYYYKALDIFIKNNDMPGMALIYEDFGDLNYEHKNYIKAHKYYIKAVEIYEDINDVDSLIRLYINIGNAIADSGRINDGILYYYKAIKMSQEIDDTEGVAICYLNIGDCYLTSGNYDQALHFFNKSFELSQTYNDIYILPPLYVNIAEVYLKQKKYKQTIEYANKSLESSKYVSWKYKEYGNHAFLSSAYEQLGDYKKAYENYKIYESYSDSIFNAKKTVQEVKLDVLFDLESREKQIVSLTKKEELRELELNNQRKMSYILIPFSLFFLTLTIVLNKQRNKRKKALALLSVEAEKAAESDRLKSLFLANMSHEIRTPMNAIMGFSSFLKDPKLEKEKRRNFIEVINISCQRLMSIINDIIDVSKIESKQLKVDIKEFKLIELLSEIVEEQKILNTKIKDGEIELKLNGSNISEDTFINTDRSRFIQIFKNLIENALKFTENGFVEIGVIEKINESKLFLEFYVKDTGCGVPKDNHLLIFDRFSQVGDNRFKKGNGLGLSICKGLVEIFKGKIWIESEVEKGSVFYVLLPK